MQLILTFPATAIAIGIGEFFGITLPENFEYPSCLLRRRILAALAYLAVELVPRLRLHSLGGSHCRLRRPCLNLLIVFALTGLWHGAAWQYVVFGLLHGIILCMERLGLRRALEQLPRLFRHLYNGGAALADAGDLRCAGPVEGWPCSRHFTWQSGAKGLYAGGLCGHQAAADFSGVLPAVRPRAGAVPKLKAALYAKKAPSPCRDGGAARAAVSGAYARHGRHLQRVYLFSILREVQSYA